MRRRKLDEGDDESEWSRLSDAREHIETNLGAVHARGDHRIADRSGLGQRRALNHPTTLQNYLHNKENEES